MSDNREGVPRPRRSRRRLGVATTIACAAAAVAVYGASSAISDASTASARTAATCNLAPLKAQLAQAETAPKFTPPGPAFNAKAASGKYVASIPQSSQIPFNEGVESGMAAAAKAVGVKFTQFDNSGTTSQWVQGMEQATNGGANAIDLFSTDPQLLQPQIKTAEAKGIKVVGSQVYDNSQVAHFLPLTHVAAITTWPFTEGAQLMADWVIVQSNCKANVQIIHDQGDVIATPVVLSVLKAQFAKYCPTCKLSYSVVSVFDWATKLQGVVQTDLVANPNINYMIPLYDPMDQYVAAGITAAGKAGKVHVVALGGIPAALQMIKTGNIIGADVATSANWEGYFVMDSVLRLLTGHKPLQATLPLRFMVKSNASQGVPDVDHAFGSSFVAGYHKLWELGS